MEKAKIHLSANELNMIRETDWIFVKKAINFKVYALFGALADELRTIIPLLSHFPDEIKKSEPKISKGENYKDLPYIILDYPRVFHTTGVFAFRTLFLWGKGISVTLHLSGQYKKDWEEIIIENLEMLEGFHYSIDTFVNNEWEHEIEIPNFRYIDKFERSRMEKPLRESIFLKIAKSFSFDEWDELSEKLLHAHASLHLITKSMK